MKKYILLSVAIFAFAISAKSIDPPTAEETPSYNCFIEEGTKVVYIDFEQLLHVIQEVVVKDKKGRVVHTQDVSSLPVDAIFELDLSDLRSEEYTVELHSPAAILQSSVSLK